MFLYHFLLHVFLCFGAVLLDISKYIYDKGYNCDMHIKHFAKILLVRVEKPESLPQNTKRIHFSMARPVGGNESNNK